MTIGKGPDQIDLHYFGRGHTSGDIIVYFPELKAIHTGDLFISGSRAGVPIYVDAVQGGSLLEWTRTLDRTLQLIGNRTALLLLREVFYGGSRFDSLVKRVLTAPVSHSTSPVRKARTTGTIMVLW